MAGNLILFADRRDAGRRLAARLALLRLRDPLILALPRGGVPVGAEIADALGAQLDVVFVRKIGAPGQRELALGAVVEGSPPQTVLNGELIRALDPPEGYVDREIAREIKEIERRRNQAGRAVPEVAGRDVVVVDDGIATGATAKAALRALRGRGAARVVLAAPVGAPDAVADLSQDCDAVVCLATPDAFQAVGSFYEDFAQTTDEEVATCLVGRPAASRSRS